jgi:hypothetical protein
VVIAVVDVALVIAVVAVGAAVSGEFDAGGDDDQGERAGIGNDASVAAAPNDFDFDVALVV